MSTPYKHLADVYDGGWFEYSEHVARLLEDIERERARPFMRVCDAACGTGLLLRYINDGYGFHEDTPIPEPGTRRLAGFDISPQMLKRAEKRVPEAQLKQGDLRDEIPFSGPFDLVTCVYDSINYLLEPADVEAFFRSARGRLFADGILLIDSNSSLMYRNRDGMEQPHLIGRTYFYEKVSYTDGPPPLVTTTFQFSAASAASSESIEIHHQRPYEAEEIETMLKNAGFRLLDTLDVLDRDLESSGEIEERAESGKITFIATPV